MRREIGVLVLLGMDVLIFVKDIPRVPMFVPGWGRTSNDLSKVSK